MRGEDMLAEGPQTVRELAGRLAAEGYAMLDGVLERETLIEPVLAEYDEVISRLADAAPMPVRHSTTDTISARLIALHAAYDKDLSRHFDVSLPLAGITERTPIHLGPAIFRLLTAPALLDAVAAVIGPEVALHPLQKIRMKLPDGALPSDAGALLDTTPWHQDVGILDEVADDTDLLTAWIPLTSATAENGALAILPGSHRNDVLVHCPIPASFGTEIPEALRPDVPPVVVEMEPGSVLFIHRRTIHYSLPNRSTSDVRLSLDLRYIPTGAPTGRPAAFPSIPVRSASGAAVIADPDDWATVWHAARSALAGVDLPTGSRWGTGHPSCE